MPVTVIARAAVEPTFKNLRFIDIGGNIPIFSFLRTAHGKVAYSEPDRSCVPRVPPRKEKTRWYGSQSKLNSDRLLNLYDTPDDLDLVLERSRLAGVKSMIITGGSLHESKEALELAQTHGSRIA